MESFLISIKDYNLSWRFRKFYIFFVDFFRKENFFMGLLISNFMGLLIYEIIITNPSFQDETFANCCRTLPLKFYAFSQFLVVLCRFTVSQWRHIVVVLPRNQSQEQAYFWGVFLMWEKFENYIINSPPFQCAIDFEEPVK